MRILFASSLALTVLSLAPIRAADCRNPVACLTVSSDLHARITLAPSTPAGVVTIEAIETGPPTSLVVEWSDLSCGTDRDLELLVNDVRFSIDVPCAVGARSFVVDDASAIASIWRENGPNTLRLVSRGRDGALAGARVRAGLGLASPSTRLLGPGTGTLHGAFELTASVVPGLPATPQLSVPFTGSRLPSSIDISGLSDGPHALCVGNGTDADCVTFDHDGEQTLLLGGDPGTVPIANAGSPSTAECASASGAQFTLDGTASTGNIASYQWYENYGQQNEALIGVGAQPQVTLGLGAHTITLKVTDPFGGYSTASVVKTVADTVAPVIRVTTSPSLLWPADHRMVDVSANVSVVEVCGSPTIVLLSVTSNEPDDAAGDADGNTTGDIQGVTTGTDDRAFQLRAETGPVFGGRRYLVTYTATDASNNKGIGRTAVSVQAPRKISPPIEPIDVPGISLTRPSGS
jgi:hypothetical protein